MKRCLQALLVIGFCFLLLPVEVCGQSKKQLEQDKAKIEREIARLSSELSKIQKNNKNQTKQITLLRKRIDERNRLITNINNQMSLLDGQILRTEDSLLVMREQIDNMKDEYARVVRSLYGLHYNVNATVLLADNETYNYSYLKLKYFKEYSRYRRHQATMIQRKQQQFEDMNLDLQRQKNEKRSLLAQEKKQRDALSREQQQQQSKLNKSQQDERVLKQQISKKEQQKRRLQQQIQQLINDEVAKSGKSSAKSSGGKSSAGAESGASADFVHNKGRLPWPVRYKSVAREYGVYTHSSGGQNRNYGIDLNCSPGAEVCAVFAGTVAQVFTTPSGTMGIIIRHGSYMTVYAGLGNVTVKSGTKVTARQVIGTVSQGDEATSEFSFQVWRDKDALNPRQWLN